MIESKFFKLDETANNEDYQELIKQQEIWLRADHDRLTIFQTPEGLTVGWIENDRLRFVALTPECKVVWMAKNLTGAN